MNKRSTINDIEIADRLHKLSRRIQAVAYACNGIGNATGTERQLGTVGEMAFDIADEVYAVGNEVAGGQGDEEEQS